MIEKSFEARKVNESLYKMSEKRMKKTNGTSIGISCLCLHRYKSCHSNCVDERKCKMWKKNVSTALDTPHYTYNRLLPFSTKKNKRMEKNLSNSLCCGDVPIWLMIA